MKETISLLLVFVLYSFTCNSQENQKVSRTISIYTNYTDALNIGISYDVEFGELDFWGISKEKNHFGAWVNNLTMTNSNLKIDDAINSIRGYGLQFDTGYKGYIAPNKKYGLYFEYFVLNGGFLYFDDTFYYADGTEKKFKGSYSYFTFLNPGLGYKIEITKNFNIDFDAGIFWRGMAEQDHGDVDKNMFRDFMPRFGLKVGWYL